MSDYVANDYQHAFLVPDDFRFDLDLDQYIDPALLDLHPSDAGQSGINSTRRNLTTLGIPVGNMDLELPSTRESTEVAKSASPSGTLVHTTTDRSTSRRGKKIRCSVPHCQHEGLFARQYKLDRHISTKHSDYKPFHCGAINCFNKTLPWRFARADKLADHIRAKHHREVLFSDCPAESCDIGPRMLEALAVHIRLAHPNLPGEARAIVSVALGQKRKCPWWRCAKHVSPDKFLAHLSEHLPDEIIAAQDSIHFEGLALADVPTTMDSAITQHHRIPAIQIVCPVCKAASSNFEQFVRHLWARHLFVDASAGPDHFLELRDTLKLIVRQTSRTTVAEIYPWTALTADLDYKDTRQFKCPRCPFSSNAYPGSSARNHHLILLRPQEDVVAELYPVRFQILRLYPEFATHPVFHDLV